MKTKTWILAAIVIGSLPAWGQPSPVDNAQHLERARAFIKGKEKVPAGEVFKNVDFLKNVPAATFLAIMDIGYSRALGVTCTHCHEEGDFAADSKRPKRAAREMQIMHRAFNDQLRAMTNAQRPPAERSINCTACHRGEVIPRS